MPAVIGCHVTPGGKQVLKALRMAQTLEASALQVFAGGRINRAISSPTSADIATFCEQASGIYMAVHAAYVVSLTAPPQSPLHASTVDYLLRALTWAQDLTMDAVVVHPGSALDAEPALARTLCAVTIDAVLDAYSGPVRLLLENSAGDQRDRLVGRDINDLEEIIGATDGTRVGICLDTCHAFAGGYTPQEIASLPATYPQIELIHFNVPSPAVSLGSRKDRHGVFDETSWNENDIAELARALAAAPLPLIMETRHTQDLARLRAFVAA